MKGIQFPNPIGKPLNINHKENIGAEYLTFHIFNFTQSSLLNLKIGQFPPYFQQCAQLHLPGDTLKGPTGSIQGSHP